MATTSILQVCLMAAIAAGATAQTSCDACGGSTTYSEAITTDGSYQKRTITASGCPNHYSVCTGKPGLEPTCGGVGEEGGASEAREQGKSIEIPAEPVLQAVSVFICRLMCPQRRCHVP